MKRALVFGWVLLATGCGASIKAPRDAPRGILPADITTVSYRNSGRQAGGHFTVVIEAAGTIERRDYTGRISRHLGARDTVRFGRAEPSAVRAIIETAIARGYFDLARRYTANMHMHAAAVTFELRAGDHSYVVSTGGPEVPAAMQDIHAAVLDLVARVAWDSIRAR